MLVLDRRFGDAAPEVTAATSAASAPLLGPASPATFYLVAVAAGLSTYFLTEWLKRRRDR